jgi:hypothetical protein
LRARSTDEPRAEATDANPRSEAPPLAVRGDDGFLAPNAKDVDGAPAYVHYAREDMPIRVNVELPRLAARYASRDQTDAGVIDAIRGWESAIQPAVPWFRLEIVRDDPDADIQVEWKTRITGGRPGGNLAEIRPAPARAEAGTRPSRVSR